MKRVWQPVAAVIMLGSSAASAVTDATALPPVATVLQRAVERAKSEGEGEREFKARYHFIRSRVTEYRNSDGIVKKREEKKGLNNPTAAPVAQPSLPAESKHRPASKPGKTQGGKHTTVSDTQSNVRGKAFEKSDFMMTDDLLSRFDFTLVGRELVNGRTTFVLDFQPANKRLPERNLKDRFINKAAGRAWLDEADYALAKADLRLTKRVNVIGGLVGAVWKFTFTFNRERTPEGFWFLRDSAWHLEGRELFVHRTVDYHEQKTDVRKVY